MSNSIYFVKTQTTYVPPTALYSATHSNLGRPSSGDSAKVARDSCQNLAGQSHQNKLYQAKVATAVGDRTWESFLRKKARYWYW